MAFRRAGRALCRLGLVAVASCASAAGGPGDRPYTGEDATFFDVLGTTARSGPHWRRALRQRRHVLPLALFAAAGALQIDGEDERLQASLSRRSPLPSGDPAVASEVGQAALIGTALIAPWLAPPHPERGVPRRTYFWTNTYGVIGSYAIATGSKKLDLRHRPPGNGSGFFSGHAMGSFVSATLLEREYGWRVGVPAYLVATATALYRVEADEHFPADVLVGAGAGILLGNLLYEKNHGDAGLWPPREPSAHLHPLLDRRGAGLAVTFRW